MKKTRQEKGITLIALIITIVVLLILAVVAIKAVQGDGILAYARNARDDYETAQANENTILQNYIDKLNANNPNGVGDNDNQNNDDNTELKITASTTGVKFLVLPFVAEGVDIYADGTGTEITSQETIERMKTSPQDGDCIEYGDYRYVYGRLLQSGVWNESCSGWGVVYIGSSQNPTKVASEIFGKPLKSMWFAFSYKNIVTAPVIPSCVTELCYAFLGCRSLTGNVEINADPTNYASCFEDTELNIKIVGLCSDTTKANLAGTATNNNVTY